MLSKYAFVVATRQKQKRMLEIMLNINIFRSWLGAGAGPGVVCRSCAAGVELIMRNVLIYTMEDGTLTK